jgi:NAD(P)-dependent dehydrogenase (short-subunit alcohol dehydrogenase family)
VSLFDKFGYKGKRALVVGGATGMGAATAALVQDAGADTIVMDRADVTLPNVQAIQLDLSDRASIDAALAQVDGPIDALFSCAGVADGTPGIERINFIGHRYLIDQLIAAGKLPSGSAIGFISSAAGMGWENNIELLSEFLDITDWDDAVKWINDHGKADYLSSKQIINTYVAREAFNFQKRGIRINGIMPGPTDTPLARANADLWLGFGSDFRDELGLKPAEPIEQAYPLVFLCSEAAAGISGIVMVTDAGYFASGVTGSFAPAKDVVGFLRSV